jgi:hypothetical protein
MQEPTPDVHVFKLIAGIAGAAVSLRFVQGTWPERIIMAAGGAALSYFASDLIARWLAVPDALGLVGFLTGLFGMAIVSKVYEVIQLIDAKQISIDIWETVKRKWGA